MRRAYQSQSRVRKKKQERWLRLLVELKLKPFYSSQLKTSSIICNTRNEPMLRFVGAEHKPKLSGQFRTKIFILIWILLCYSFSPLSSNVLLQQTRRVSSHHISLTLGQRYCSVSLQPKHFNVQDSLTGPIQWHEKWRIVTQSSSQPANSSPDIGLHSILLSAIRSH